MKKTTSQITVAFVCAILGFLLAYQFKVLSNKETNIKNTNNSDIISEIEGLKKEKEELAKANDELTLNLKNIEDNATREGDVQNEVSKQLNNTRMQLGLVDVTGEGLEITITPKKNLFSSNSTTSANLGSQELVHLVNSLLFYNAEAISINEYRITPQTGIMLAGDVICIGYAGRISPTDPIIIKAIGKKEGLNVLATFASGSDLTYGQLAGYGVDAKMKDDIVIKKTTQSLKSEFVKPVNG